MPPSTPGPNPVARKRRLESTGRRRAEPDAPCRPGSTGSGPAPGLPLSVAVELYRTDGELRVTVRDNGVGLPPGFSIDNTSGLGPVHRARAWCGPSSAGTITMHSNGGTVVDVVIPVDHPIEDLESI